MNDTSSMEPVEKISAVSMHKDLTGASVEPVVSCRELDFNRTKSEGEH